MVNSLCSCPHCSHTIRFSDMVSNHMVCGFCGNIVYLQPDSTAVAKFVPVISTSDDQIRIGTEGVWQGKQFMVTGRFRVWYEESVFNYWSIDLNDGRIFYLAEGYGLYTIYQSLLLPEPLKSQELEVFKLDARLAVPGVGEYGFLRKNDGHYWDAEGSFYKKDGPMLRSFEAMSDGGKLIAVLEFDKNNIDVFAVHAVDREDLKLTGVKESLLSGKKFMCTQCNHENTVVHYPYAQSWVCEKCESAYCLISSGQAKRVSHVQEQIVPAIPLGTSLSLKGTDYKVVGFVCKEDGSGQIGRWREYTLRDDQNGYAFLNESEGHWMLVKEAMESPPPFCINREFFWYKSMKFRLYSKYQFRIVHARGEFPGNIFNDNYAGSAFDFISTSELWSVERGKNEGITWFHGTHISKKSLQKQVGDYLPLKQGVGMLQPTGIPDGGLLIKTAMVLLLLVVGIHIIFSVSSKEKVILDRQFTMVDSLSAQSFVTEPFQLTKWKSNLEFEMSAPVDNTWFEVGATLVNVRTGDEYSIQQGVEYYHGYTEGENWAEGGQTETAYLSSIPSGQYFLRIDGVRDASVTGYAMIPYFRVKVIYDVPMLRNTIFTILALIIYPVLAFWYSTSVDQRRWWGSPYSPYEP